jgi:hypothetical protein
MLDKIKNVSSMIQTANKLKQQQERLQKILSTIRVNGQSKNQKVTVTITGEQKNSEYPNSSRVNQLCLRKFYLSRQRRKYVGQSYYGGF